MNKKVVSILSILVVGGGLAFTNFAYGTVDTAVTYLHTKANDPWNTMAFVAAGETPSANYINTNPAAGSTQVLEVEKDILAIVAAGGNPRTHITGTDLVAELKSFYSGGQIGSVASLNDDIFGILALGAVGEENSTEAQGAKTFILSHQLSDGGWGWAVAATSSDSNDTAMAVSALLEAGLPKTDGAVVNAVNYLKSAQNTDGGFTYDPNSSFGTGSDANSDAWVISAIYKLGENPADAAWTKSGHTAVGHLNSLQNAAGYFGYQLSSEEENGFSAQTTAQAVIALSGKSYPVTPGNSGGNNNQTGVEVHYKFENSTGGFCEGTTYAADAMEVVVDAATHCSLTYHLTHFSFGDMLDQFGPNIATDTEFWLYAVNFISPDVGAADYDLQAGDYVVWHFGPWPWDPATSGQTLGLSANVTADPANPSGVHTVSFSVNTSGTSLGFGDVVQGATSVKTVTLHNQGQSGISVKSNVVGNDFFRNNIYINNNDWRTFTESLTGGQSKDETVKLQVPADAPAGAKSGSLIFWGTPN